MRITPTLHKAGLAAFAATLTALPATAVNAATKTWTSITISGLPATISYGQFQQTVHGSLGTRVATGETPQPIPDATIGVYELPGTSSTRVLLATTTTDGNGEFSAPVTLPTPGFVEATFAGDDTYYPSQYGAKVAPASTLPTKITLQGPASTAPNATIAVTGQITMQATDGTWVPAPYESAAPSGVGIAPRRVDADTNGQFSFSATATHSFPPSVCLYPKGTFARQTCSAPLVTPYSSYPVQITDFKARTEPLNPGHFSFFADVSYQPDDAGTAPYNGPIVLKYQPRGSSTWIQMASGTTTGSYGEVDFTNLSGFLPGGKGILAAGGTWEVQTPAHDTYLASMNSDQMSISPTVDAWTYITHSTVTSHSGRHYLTGYLTDDHTVGPVPHMRIKVYYRKAKTDSPHYLGYVTTGSNGQFSYTLTGHPHGYYQAVFAGAPMPGGADAVGYFFNSNGAQVYYH